MMTKNKSTARRLLTVWLVSFPLFIALLLGAAYYGGLLLAMGGGGRILADLTEYSLPFILALLATSALLSSGVTIVAAIFIWMFQRESAEVGSSNSSAGKSHPKQYVSVERDWKQILSPSTGLGTLVVSLLILALYLTRPAAFYDYWQWLAFALPVLAIAIAGLGVMRIVLDYRYQPSLLPRAGWRLRVVLAIVSIGWIASAITTNFNTCSEEEMLGIVRAQNVTSLKYYLASHRQCKINPEGYSRNPEIAKVFKNIVEADAGHAPNREQFNRNKYAMIAMLADYDAFESELQWPSVLEYFDNDELHMLWAALKIDSTDSPRFPQAALNSMLIGNNYAEDHLLVSLNRLTGSGLQIGPVSGLKLIDAVLSKPKPAWQLYDALITAGVVVPPRMRDLIAANRARSIISVQGWSQADWQRPVDEKVWGGVSYSFLNMAMGYADDFKIRDQILALAGTTPGQYLKTQRLPYRCMQTRFKVAEIRASMAEVADDDAGKSQCEDLYLPVLENEQKQTE
jgi:hypothetical protein